MVKFFFAFPLLRTARSCTTTAPLALGGRAAAGAATAESAAAGAAATPSSTTRSWQRCDLESETSWPYRVCERNGLALGEPRGMVILSVVDYVARAPAHARHGHLRTIGREPEIKVLARDALCVRRTIKLRSADDDAAAGENAALAPLAVRRQASLDPGWHPEGGGVLGSGSYPDRGSVPSDSHQNALP